MGQSKIHDTQKLDQLIKQVVNPDLLWNEIANKLQVFSVPMRFEGGFEQSALVNEKWGMADYRSAWWPAFPAAIRSIRNALSHGRELRTGAVILPTASNLRRLQAWVPLVAVAAREVMIYRGVI